MSADYTPYYVLLTCCLCLLCIVVLAIVVVAIVMVMRKRKTDAPAPELASQPPAPAAQETVLAKAPEIVQPAPEPEPPVQHVEPYAAQTMIASGPIVIEKPAPKEEKGENPFPQGSVAAASFDVGFDIRDLKMMGFSDDEMTKFKKEEIQAVLDGKYSLADLRRSYQDS
jgi:hypothetical protein